VTTLPKTGWFRQTTVHWPLERSGKKYPLFGNRQRTGRVSFLTSDGIRLPATMKIAQIRSLALLDQPKFVEMDEHLLPGA
jgi:hypothetical protein